MSTLTKIVALAKKLKKEAPNKFAKWTDYIKEASKKIKPVVKQAKKYIGETKTKIKKEYNIDYTIFLGEIISNNNNVWKVYQKDITKRKGQYITYDWQIVRKSDGLILSNVNLPKEVSLYDFNQNKELIKNLIDKKEMSNVGYSTDRINTLKKATPKIKKLIKKGYSRKKAIKEAGIGETHKDTNSHNVKLSIYSGVNDNNLNELKNSLFLLEVYQSELNSLLNNPNQYPYNDLPKKIYNDVLKRLKDNINLKKRQIVQIKKLIK
jgi:hypothetical protein